MWFAAMIDGAATTTLYTHCGLESIYRFMRPFVVRDVCTHTSVRLLFMQWIDSPKCASMQRSHKKSVCQYELAEILSPQQALPSAREPAKAIQMVSAHKIVRVVGMSGARQSKHWKTEHIFPISFLERQLTIGKRYLWLFSWDWVLN